MTHREALTLKVGDLVMYDKRMAGYAEGEIYGVVTKIDSTYAWITYEDGREGHVYLSQMRPFTAASRF